MNETQEDFAFIFNSLKLALQKICREDYQPTILIADGSAAIENGFREAYNHLTHRVMCWAHAVRNIDKHLNLKKMQIVGLKLETISCSFSYQLIVV